MGADFEVKNIDGTDYYLLSSFAVDYWYAVAVGDPLSLVKVVKVEA